MMLRTLWKGPERYVQEVMGTTQVVRHREGYGKQMIAEAECRNRARVLIDAYAASLP